MAQKRPGQDGKVLGLSGIMLAFLALSMNLLPMTGGPAVTAGIVGNSDNESRPTPCAVGYFVNSVNETNTPTNGTIIISCTQVGWTQLTGYPSNCSSNQFVTAIGAVLTCSTVSYTGLTNFPTGCSAGQFVTGIGITLTCTTVAWTQLTSFPSSCSSGQFVTAVGVTLTCTNDNNNPTCTGGDFIHSNSFNCTDPATGTQWYFTASDESGGGGGCSNVFRAIKIVKTTNTISNAGVTIVATANTQFAVNSTGVLAIGMTRAATGSCQPGTTAAEAFFTFSSGTWGTVDTTHLTGLWTGYCYCIQVFMINSTSWGADIIDSSAIVNRIVVVGGTFTSKFSTGVQVAPSFSNQAPQLVTMNNQVNKTATVTAFTYTPAQVNQIFEVGGDLDTVLFTSGTISLTVTYTDWNSHSQTLTLGSATAISDLNFNVESFMVKRGTVITCATTGTFTATYTVVCELIWLGFT